MLPNARRTVIFKRLLGPLIIFSVVINLLTLVLPIYMLQIYDRVLTSRNLNTLLLLTIIAFAFLAVGSMLIHYRSRMAARLGTQITHRMEQYFFPILLKDHLEGKPGWRPLIQELDFIREFIGGGNMVRLFDLPWTPLFLLVIFLFHPLIGFVAVGFALILLLTDWLADRNRRGRGERFQKAKAEANQFLDSSLSRPEEIWTMGMVGGIGAHWQRHRARALNEHTEATDTRSRHDAFALFFQQGAQMAMLGIGAFLAVQDQISAGMIVAGSIICSRALSPIRGAARSLREYRDVRELLAGFREQSSNPEEHANSQISMGETAQLKVQNLTVDLGHSIEPGICHVELSLNPGDTMSIVGPSGTGKSLLAKTLVGARRPAAGTIRINGIDLRSLSNNQLGRMIGYVPEQPALFNGTLGQNIARFGSTSLADLNHAAQRAGIAKLVDLLPQAFDTPITVAAKRLSPTHLRFVALARALYGNPTLLVLDQIDKGMDQASLQVLYNIIEYSRGAGQIAILVTNRASIVQRLDRVLVLSKSGVVTCCGVDQLVATSGAGQMTNLY